MPKTAFVIGWRLLIGDFKQTVNIFFGVKILWQNSVSNLG